MMSRALVFVFACIAITNAQLAPHVPGKASPWTWDNCGTKLDRLETDKVSVSGKFIADNKVRPRFAAFPSLVKSIKKSRGLAAAPCATRTQTGGHRSWLSHAASVGAPPPPWGHVYTHTGAQKVGFTYD